MGLVEPMAWPRRLQRSSGIRAWAVSIRLGNKMPRHFTEFPFQTGCTEHNPMRVQ